LLSNQRLVNPLLGSLNSAPLKSLQNSKEDVRNRFIQFLKKHHQAYIQQDEIDNLDPMRFFDGLHAAVKNKEADFFVELYS